MEQDKLKYLRVLIPGFVVLVGLLPIRGEIGFLGFGLSGLDFNYVILLALLCGAIYYQISLQHVITRPSHFVINRNIFHSLLGIYGKEVDVARRREIWKKRVYRDIFYNIVDNDESLKRRAKLVYFNGIFWTSSADIAVISILYFLAYRFDFLVAPNKVSTLSSFFAIAVLSLFLHGLSIFKHIRLGNDQLDYIKVHKKQEVIKQFDAIL